MSYIHGHTSEGRKTLTYMAWGNMRQRCFNPRCDHYSAYGERGIGICPEWEDFSSFLADMGEKPKDKSIDRINNDGHYCPENCRWATFEEQMANRNKPSYRFFAFNMGTGEKVVSNNQRQFAVEYNLDQSSISKCLCGERKVHKKWEFFSLPRW